jgi:SAM-dependent methyltransferase
MDPRVWMRFDRAVRELGIRPAMVLEVGITTGQEALLKLPSLAHAKRHGLDLAPPPEPFPGFATYIQANAHAIPFQDGDFDLVLSNAMLEHDPKFWLSVAEMRRVTAPGGWLILGTPAFDETGRVLETHRYPLDCYRFGVDVVRSVWLEGFERIGCEVYLDPPRLIAWGRRPGP